MSKTTKYKQCMLRNGFTEQVSWIPSLFAKTGSVVRLRDKNGDWEDGWEVISVGTETEEQYIPDPHASSKSLWRATSGASPVGHK